MSAMTWAACSSTTFGGLVLGLVELLDALQRRQILRRPPAVLPRQALSLDPARSSRRALRLSDTLCCPRTESMAAMSDTSQR